MYSPRHAFSEIAIQAMAGEGLKTYLDFAGNDDDILRNRLHETALPVFHVNKDFIGDRYGEAWIPVPFTADWNTQTRPDAHKDYYWWLSGDADLFSFYGPKARSDLLIQGWAAPETTFTWSVGSVARLRLPTSRLDGSGDFLLGLLLEPIRDIQRLVKQVIDVKCNDRFSGCFSVRDNSLVETVLPEDMVRQREFLEIEIHIHLPRRPCDMSSYSNDSRLLGIALRYAKLGRAC